MKRSTLTAICLTVAGVFSVGATPALAYVGPGAGLSVIGAFLALVLGVILAFVGFIWYPVKRLLRRGTPAGAAPHQPQPKPHTGSIEEGA